MGVRRTKDEYIDTYEQTSAHVLTDMMVAEDSPSQGEANQTRESCTFDRSVWIHSK